MSNEASERLIRLSEKIMIIWEDRATKEVSAAVNQTSLALRNSLPEFLSQIVTALSTTIDRTHIKIKWDREESTRLGKKHGLERATSQNYTMDQLIFEYHIFRQVICEIMEEEAPLSAIEREVIVCAVEQAVNDAATQFSETLYDIQEALTHTLAHDLRGPITTSKLSAQLLLKRPNDVNHCINIASRISTSMDRIDLMIHDLLDASALRSGATLNLDYEVVDLDILLDQIANEANFLHSNRIRFVSDGPLIGFWNENGLKRVFDNLITNALKFSDPESIITIKLKLINGKAVAEVQNFGKIITSEDMSILFQQFRRVRERTGSGKKGWGLGLTVVKGIVEAHKGNVEVESSEKSGTIFTIFLPLNIQSFND